MRKISFIITLAGILLLAFLLLFQKPIKINSQSDLSKLEDNQLVSLSGIVSSERSFSTYKLLTINNITLSCKCTQKYLNKSLSITGILEEFNNKKTIKVLTLSSS